MSHTTSPPSEDPTKRYSTPWTHIQDVSIGLVLIRVLEVSVAYEDRVHVGAGILVQLVVAGDHDNSNLHVTQNAELVSLLQETGFTLAESYLRTISHVHHMHVTCTSCVCHM